MGMGVRSRNKPPQTPALPLPEWLQKSRGKDSAVCCEAAAAPRFAVVFE